MSLTTDHPQTPIFNWKFWFPVTPEWHRSHHNSKVLASHLQSEGSPQSDGNPLSMYGSLLETRRRPNPRRPCSSGFCWVLYVFLFANRETQIFSNPSAVGPLLITFTLLSSCSDCSCIWMALVSMSKKHHMTFRNSWPCSLFYNFLKITEGRKQKRGLIWKSSCSPLMDYVVYSSFRRVVLAENSWTINTALFHLNLSFHALPANITLIRDLARIKVSQEP